MPSRVIFDTRKNADGTINKCKARLIAQGNYQSTYFNTFADTSSARSINVLLCNLEISSIDVKTAFFIFLNTRIIISIYHLYLLSSTVMPPLVKLNKGIYLRFSNNLVTLSTWLNLPTNVKIHCKHFLHDSFS